jgi:hypothetical protein
MRRGAAIGLIALLSVVFATIAVNYSQRSSLPELAAAYVDLVPRKLGAPNVITGILLTYRAFDTLGEVAVLFMVAAGVGLLLGAGGEERDRPLPGSAGRRHGRRCSFGEGARWGHRRDGGGEARRRVDHAAGSLVLLSYLIGLTYVAKQENLREYKNVWPLAFLFAPFIYAAGAYGFWRMRPWMWPWAFWSGSSNNPRKIPRTACRWR